MTRLLKVIGERWGAYKAGDCRRRIAMSATDGTLIVCDDRELRQLWGPSTALAVALIRWAVIEFS